jgi:GxxExxY protein
MKVGYGESTTAEEEAVGRQVVDAAIKVHKALGPGLLESAYEAVLEQELLSRGLRVRRQIKLPIKYENLTIDEGFRLDLLVEELVIVDVKSLHEMHPIFTLQVTTHLRLMNLHLGYVMNFNSVVMKDGIKRVVRTSF